MRLVHSLIVIILLTLSFKVPAEELYSYQLYRPPVTDLKFDEVRLGGFERHKLSDSMRVRGWQLGERTYFGQAKVGKKWGLGFVIENGDTVYGINHRGIQIMRRF